MSNFMESRCGSRQSGVGSRVRTRQTLSVAFSCCAFVSAFPARSPYCDRPSPTPDCRHPDTEPDAVPRQDRRDTAAGGGNGDCRPAVGADRRWHPHGPAVVLRPGAVHPDPRPGHRVRGGCLPWDHDRGDVRQRLHAGLRFRCRRRRVAIEPRGRDRGLLRQRRCHERPGAARAHPSAASGPPPASPPPVCASRSHCFHARAAPCRRRRRPSGTSRHAWRRLRRSLPRS